MDVGIVLSRCSIHVVEDGLGVEVVEPHQSQCGAGEHRGHTVLVGDEGVRLAEAQAREGHGLPHGIAAGGCSSSDRCEPASHDAIRSNVLAEFGKLPSHPRGHRANLFVEFAVHDGLVDGQDSRQVVGPGRPVGVDQCNAIASGCLPGGGANKLPQCLAVAHDSLVHRRLQTTRKRKGPNREDRVTKLKHPDEFDDGGRRR